MSDAEVIDLTSLTPSPRAGAAGGSSPSPWEPELHPQDVDDIAAEDGALADNHGALAAVKAEPAAPAAALAAVKVEPTATAAALAAVKAEPAAPAAALAAVKAEPAAAGGAAPAAAEPEPQLSREQEAALASVKNGRSIFVTGSAGVGKTFFLAAVRRWCAAREKVVNSAEGGTVWFTATTGVAAVLIEGWTIHAFAGGRAAFTLLDAEKIYEQLAEKAVARWRHAELLVIDEISMLSDRNLQCLDELGRLCRGRDELPFGGLQLILAGDFFQLPPVAGKKAFLSPSWAGLLAHGMTVHEFEIVHRQGGDEQFKRLLQEMRIGLLSDRSMAMLSSRQKRRRPPADAAAAAAAAGGGGGPRPMKIFPTRIMVQRENEKRLAALPGPVLTVEAVDCFRQDRVQHVPRDRSMLECRFDTTLQLKRGAQVMLLVNLDLDAGLVNGSRGVVVDWTQPDANDDDEDGQDAEMDDQDQEEPSSALPAAASRPCPCSWRAATGPSSALWAIRAAASPEHSARPASNAACEPQLRLKRTNRTRASASAAARTSSGVESVE